jgi:hypothetical protein
LNAVPLNSWSHVAALYDGNLMKVFVNGQLDATLTVGAITPETTTSPLTIGYTNETGQARYFDGAIDEVEIFNRSLSAVEIKAIFDASIAGKCNSAPVASGQSITTDANTAIGVTLGATDAENNFLTYAVVTPPLNGVLSGTGAEFDLHTEHRLLRIGQLYVQGRTTALSIRTLRR